MSSSIMVAGRSGSASKQLTSLPDDHCPMVLKEELIDTSAYNKLSLQSLPTAAQPSWLLPTVEVLRRNDHNSEPPISF